jgi:hypothetical protein
MKPDMTNDELDAAISNWKVLNKRISTMSEVDVKGAINRELVGNRRKDIVKRLHQRFCKLRGQRELMELQVALEDTPVFLKSTVQF